MNNTGEVLNRYVYNGDQLVDTSTGEIVDKNAIQKAYDQELIQKYHDNSLELIQLGLPVNLRVVKDKKGNEYHSYNVKEGFHFVKVFKVDVRGLLETSKMSMMARGFIYSCLAYMHFPTNTLIMDGETPNTEKICEKFVVGKTKLYQIYKELEELDVIKRKKINGQWVIYLNPFLHSSGLVAIETYNLFRNSIFNPESINN